jgi:hypothetical protein
MAKHVVFMLHGMGTFDSDWEIGSRDRLKRHASLYEVPAFEKTLDTQFSFFGITYNSVFADWQKQWRDDAAAAAKAATDLGMESGLADELVKAAGAASGNSFLQTHLLDVALFYSFDLLCQQVQAHVAGQIVNRLLAEGQNNIPSWSVVAHSLGTAVLAETLNALFSHRIQGLRLPEANKPLLVAMVANTSRLLWNKKADFYSTKMRPVNQMGEGLCRHYLNVRHKLDPVPQLKPFHPPQDDWFDADVDRATSYANITLDVDALQSEDVHSLDHYLSHPDVHVPLIRLLTRRPDIITKQELNKQREAWEKKTLGAQALSKAKAKLGELASKADDPLSAALTKWLRYRLDIGLKHSSDGEQA